MNVDNPFEYLPTISICTGIRGLERGIERVTGPLRTLAYVEIEAFLVKNLLAGIEAGVVAAAPIWPNLKTFLWQQFRGKVGLLVGGYPCQPFSTAGRRKGADDPRHLWPYIKYGIGVGRPICCFFENVSGHLSLGFEEVAGSLQDMGYAVEAGIYTAAEVGAPHKRARLFILAILDDAKRSKWGTQLAEWIRCYQDRVYSDRPQSSIGSAGASQELADTHSLRPGTATRGGGKQGSANESQTHGQERYDIFRQWSGTNVGHRGSNVADTGNERLQGGQQHRASAKGFGAPESFGPAPQRGFNGWPARPGQQQSEWEEPRTIKSGLGCSVNGYNYREDLLRALGNGVVEQQAELAFIDLLRKHFPTTN